MKEFAKRHYKNIAYFNFDEHPEYKQFFESTKDVERILQNLMMANGEIIKQDKPQDTLIVFDEIQECYNALNALKYFSIEPIPEAFFNPLYEKLKMYFVTGGMPESVRSWAQD